MSFKGIPRSASLGMCLAALLVGAPGAGAAVSPVSVEASSTNGTARLRFIWSEKVVATSAPEGGGVVVTVDREVDAKAVRDAVAMLPAWIGVAEADGRRLKLVPQPGRSATVAALPRGIEIRLTQTRATANNPAKEAPLLSSPPAPPVQVAQAPSPQPSFMIGSVTVVPTSEVAQAASAPDAETAAALRRLRLTKARLLMETGDAEGAKAELEALLREVPSSIEVMAALASVETQLGGWRRAVGLYDRALGLNPDDPSLVRAKAELLREYGPRVRFDIDHRKVKKADRQAIARFSGETLAGGSIAGFALEGNDLDTPLVRRPNGALQGFDGKRFRGEGYVSLDHEKGGITRLSLIGGTGIVGAGIRHTRPFADGTLRLAAIAQDPYWDVVDGLVNEARTDRVQAGYERILGTNWRIAGRLAAGRYGIEGRSDVAQFIGPGFELAYTAYQGPPSITFAYGLDAEYLGGRKVATDSFGAEYPLLSVVSREVHSGTVGVSGTLSSYSRYSLYGGYAYDRLNSDGPFLGAELVYEPYTSFELGFVASHSLTASRGTDSTVTRLGGYFLWRF
jgi:tetratricopeptide (TPR) repeat protein